MHIDGLDIELTNEQKNTVRRLLSRIAYLPNGEERYIRIAREAICQCLPQPVLELLYAQRTSNEPVPYFVIHNLPTDEEVIGSPFPHESGMPFKSGTLSENQLVGITAVVGEPYSIVFEGKELVVNLVPQKESKQELHWRGSEIELDFHTENAALRFLAAEDYSPVGLALLGVRHDSAAPRTRVSDARAALDLMDRDDVATLYGSHFIIQLPYRWRGLFFGDREHTDACPVLHGPVGLPRVNAAFYRGMMLPVNSRAETEFGNFHEAIRAVSHAVDITPGTFVYVDNRFALHSRDAFVANFDENARGYRWVQRVYVASNLWNFRAFARQGNRIFDPAGVAEEVTLPAMALA